MEIFLKPNLTKEEAFQKVEELLKKKEFSIVTYDKTRPWGGFFVINENESQKFIDLFFNNAPQVNNDTFAKLSPKILIVEEGKRLSWQYHHRRSEVWKVVGGKVAVVRSINDQQTPKEYKKLGDLITLQQGERHRLIGTEGWGIVAEIWQHTDINNPSDENDIIRVEDDFGRSS